MPWEFDNQSVSQMINNGDAIPFMDFEEPFLYKAQSNLYDDGEICY